MSRSYKFVLFAIAAIFVLACNFVTQPIRDVQDIAGTAESFATAMPFETLQALGTAFPIETLGALPTQLSQFGNFFDPQGTPAAEWNGIPIMPQATAGQEFDTANYSFRYSGTVKEASDFYSADALGAVGWSPMINMGGDEQSALLIYQKDDHIITFTITNMNDGSIVVLLTLT